MVSIDFSSCKTPVDMVAKYSQEVSAKNALREDNVALLAALINKRFKFSFSNQTIQGLIKIYHPSASERREKGASEHPGARRKSGAPRESANARYDGWEALTRYMSYSSVDAKDLEPLFTVNDYEDAAPGTGTKVYQPERIGKSPVGPAFAAARRSLAPGKGAAGLRMGSSRSKSEPYLTFAKMRDAGPKYDDLDKLFMYYTPKYKALRFLAQAEYMKDFRDDYPHMKAFITYPIYAVYENMDDDQLRVYFTWRAGVWRNEARPIYKGYVFCYIQELLNGIHGKTPSDTMDALVAVWKTHRTHIEELDTFMKAWIRDYFVLWNERLPMSFSEYRAAFPEGSNDASAFFPAAARDAFSEAIVERVVSGDMTDLSVIELSSSYKITKGAFYKKTDSGVIERCIAFLSRSLADYCLGKGADIKRLLYSEKQVVINGLFPNTVFDHDSYSDLKPFRVDIGARARIRKRENDWCFEYICLDTYKPAVAFILKMIECKMRSRFDFAGRITPPALSSVENCFIASEGIMAASFYGPKYVWDSLEKLAPWKKALLAVFGDPGFEAFIENEIESFLKLNHMYVKDGSVIEVKPVEINLDNLDKIRDELNHTAARLNTEADSESPYSSPAADTSADEDTSAMITGAPDESFTGLAASLTGGERALLLSLISRDAASHSRSGADTELIVESINEKALAHIGDNLIDGVDGLYMIYEEYLDDIKKVAR